MGLVDPHGAYAEGQRKCSQESDPAHLSPDAGENLGTRPPNSNENRGLSEVPGVEAAAHNMFPILCCSLSPLGAVVSLGHTDNGSGLLPIHLRGRVYPNLWYTVPLMKVAMLN
jgi:hypothetical protein